MENKKANIIAISLVLFLIIILIISRYSLKLSHHFYLICGADVAAILAVVAVLVIRQRFHTRRKLFESRILSEGRELRIEYSFLRKVAGVPTKFQFKELDKATEGFQTLLGKGGSGSVFKGYLNDGTAVAVKRIEGGGEKGEKEFKSEVSAIASIQHVNLVRLVGYCSPSKGPRYLVYEFFPKGSLDNWIFGKKEGSSSPHGCLSWDLRCGIALDVARALSYLHHDCRKCILHLDIKPENILLDADFRALVSDFGLSRLKGKEESRIVTNIRGTRGYLAPEWLLENGISEKCDVYSFGMVLLELIGGRRNIVAIEQVQGHDKKSKKRFNYFPKVVNEKFREKDNRKLIEVVDQRLVESGDIDQRQLTIMVCVALWCIQEIPRLRPSMNIVVEMLEGRVSADNPPDTQMLVVDLLSINDDDSGIVEHGTPRFGPKAKRKNNFEYSVSDYSTPISGFSGR